MASISSVVSEPFVDYETTVSRCMDIAGVVNLLGDGRPIMLKPNLVNNSPHPITAPPAGWPTSRCCGRPFVFQFQNHSIQLFQIQGWN